MPKAQKGYEDFIKQLRQEWHDWQEGEPYSEARLSQFIQRTEAYLEAAGDLTRDEIALISQYVRRDLSQFADAPGGYKDSAFYAALKESIWGGLLELTDRSQLEWQELLADVSHKGIYRAGDMMGLGVLVCEQCGHRRNVLHPEKLTPCVQCGGESFTREPLAP